MFVSSQRLLIVFTAAAGLSAPSLAAEYCVTCNGPDAVYRCQTGSTDEKNRADPREQFLCISQLASEGGHKTCSVNRVQTGECAGPIKTVAGAPDIPEGMPVIAAPPEGTEAAKPIEIEKDAAAADAADAPAENPDAPPKTVEEMAKRSAQSTGDAIENAGESVKKGAEAAGEGVASAGEAAGKAAKSTWDCVTSLFSDC